MNKVYKEHKIRIVRGIHSSEDDRFIGEKFQLINIEVDGVVYHQQWTDDMPLMPWMIEPLIDDSGAPEEVLELGIIEKQLLSVIKDIVESVTAPRPSPWRSRYHDSKLQ